MVKKIRKREIDLYLNLLKKALCYLIWEESESPIGIYGGSRKFKIFGGQLIVKFLRRFNLRLMRSVKFDRSKRESGQDWPIKAHTMMGLKRLTNIQLCAQKVIQEKIEGDFIETGVWRGGGAIFMQGILTVYNQTQSRKVWVADSFEGLPQCNKELYPKDSGDWTSMNHSLAISIEEVKENFKRYDLLGDNVIFLKGWFKDTLPVAPIEKLAILRLDGDMYESTMDSLNNLYNKLQPGGFLIVDDYRIDSCLAAVSDFRNKNGINDEILIIDDDSAYLRKS